MLKMASRHLWYVLWSRCIMPWLPSQLMEEWIMVAWFLSIHTALTSITTYALNMAGKAKFPCSPIEFAGPPCMSNIHLNHLVWSSTSVTVLSPDLTTHCPNLSLHHVPSLNLDLTEISSFDSRGYSTPFEQQNFSPNCLLCEKELYTLPNSKRKVLLIESWPNCQLSGEIYVNRSMHRKDTLQEQIHFSCPSLSRNNNLIRVGWAKQPWHEALLIASPYFYCPP